VKNLKATGAVAPSSKFLAQNVVNPLQSIMNPDTFPPANILEIGPGTGALTREIVKKMRPADSLDVVEVQEKFFQIIKSKYQAENIAVYLNDFMKFEPDKRYKFIFSSLPYDNMPRRVIRKIWQKKLSLCTPDAYICYFKYVKFRKFKCNYEKQVVNKYTQNKKFVLRNLPPAKVYTLLIDKASPSAILGV
jgi:phospholipid N-methyltransferase